MPRALKLSALSCCLLALLFSFIFMNVKHDAVLSRIAPFVDDPYDAVGSFADEAVIFLSLLAIFRAFRPGGNDAATLRQQSALARTEMAVPLCVLVAVGSNAIAMARHPGSWVGTPAASRLFTLQAGMALAGLGFGIWVWVIARAYVTTLRPSRWIRAMLVLLAGVLILSLYPGNLRAAVPGALVTVEVGALVLFASLWTLGTALMPEPSGEPIPSRPPLSWWGRRGMQWGVVVVLAVTVGLVLVAVESTEGGGAPLQLPRLAFIASVYVGLEVVGVLIGFTFLRRWLDLFP